MSLSSPKVPTMKELLLVCMIVFMRGCSGYSDEQQTGLMISGASTGQSKGSAVVKIIQMLGEMKAKTQADIDEEAKSMEEFMQYCSDGAKEKQFSLKTTVRSIEENTALIAESKATISALEDEVETLSTSISSKEKELEEATSIRKAEQVDFKAVEKDLVNSVKQLGGAIAEVEKGQASFIQGKGRKARKEQKRLADLASALSSVVQSVKLTGEQRKSIKSFLLQSSNADQDDLSLSRTLSGSGTRKAGGILEILKDTKDQAEAELTEARKAEMESSHEYKLLKQSLENELGTKKKRTADAQSEKAATEDALGKAEGELAESSEMKAADEEFLKTLRGDCQTKAVEWEHRLQSAKGEIAALDKAAEILQKGTSSAFIQVSVRRKVQSRSSTIMGTGTSDAVSDDEDEDDTEQRDEDRRRKAVNRLRILQRKYRSNSLAQLVSRMKSDPMAKIKGLIEEMIAKLMAEAQAEASQKAFCDEEMGKSKKALEIKTGKINKYQARLDEAQVTRSKAEEEIKELETAMAAIDDEQAEATKIRKQEHEEFLKAQKDFKSASDACTEAIAVLKEYYQGASLLQVRSSSETSGDNSEAGATIIAFLETAEADFSNLLAEVEAAEEKAQQDFETLSSDNKVSKASKSAEAKGKASQAKMLASQIEDLKDDRDSTQKELDAVTMYMEKLKPECESKVMSAGDKIASRKAEIEGLKDALSILEGEEGAAFVQTRHRSRSGYLRGVDFDSM